MTASIMFNRLGVARSSADCCCAAEKGPAPLISTVCRLRNKATGKESAWAVRSYPSDVALFSPSAAERFSQLHDQSLCCASESNIKLEAFSSTPSRAQQAECFSRRPSESHSLRVDVLSPSRLLNPHFSGELEKIFSGDALGVSKRNIYCTHVLKGANIAE